MCHSDLVDCKPWVGFIDIIHIMAPRRYFWYKKYCRGTIYYDILTSPMNWSLIEPVVM